MIVTPLDIQQKRFHVAFRGYDRKEVEDFLDLVRDEMENLVREVTELREFRQTYDERMREYKEREETLKNTMVTTQKLAEDVKEHARKEATVIIKDAEVRSQQIVARSQEEKVKLEAEIHELRRRRHHAIQDLKKVLQMHLEMVNFEEAGEEAKKGGTPEKQ
jgi:cell division initiation protein